MKLTARIKHKTSPVAKLVRRMSSGRPMIILDPMGDSALLRRVMAAARKAGRLNDFCRVDEKPSRSTFAASDISCLAGAAPEQAQAVLSNTNTKIFLKH